MSKIPVHSRLAPSASHRWAYCPASVKFIEDNAHLLPQQDWKYADEGTRAHSIAGNFLEIFKTNRAFPTPSNWGDNEEMRPHVEAYVRFVLDHMGEGDRLLVESRVPLFYFPEQRGTIDVAVFGPRGIYIIDLKYGAGVSVEARKNTQLAIYAESLIQQQEIVEEIPDDTLVTLCIYQPRDRNNPEPVRLWVLTRLELRQFCVLIESTARMILNPGEGNTLLFKADPDKQCRFCPAKGLCSAHAAYELGVIPQDEAEAGKPIVLPNPDSLTREQRCNIIAMMDGVTAWMEAVKAQELHELLAGAEPLTFKVVEGKSNRKWTDEGAAEKLLRNYLNAEEVRPPGDIVSITQAEKLLKGKELSAKFSNKLATLVTKPEGKPTLALLSDKRQPLVISAAAELENLDII